MDRPGGRSRLLSGRRARLWPPAAAEDGRLRPQPAGADVTACGGPARYEIRVAGVLDSCWATWFDGLQVIAEGEETVISGLLTDQPALHGLLAKIRDLGLTLTSVHRLAPSGEDEAS